jgi:hypothetical protein
MKRFVLAAGLPALLFGSAAFLRADFTYQEISQMTGGSMAAMLKALGPLTRAAREPIVSTHIVKGNRMATVTKDRVSVIDLDKETITNIDTAKKTYSVMTFAEMKQTMDQAVQRMQGRQKGDQGDKNNDVQAQFKVSAKSTGQTKNVQGLNAKEVVIAMAMEGTNTKTGDTGAMEFSTDAWYAPIPGYDEVKEFHKKMAVKLGNIFGSGMQQIAQMAATQGGQANMSQGMEQVAKELSKIDGVPVESLIKMGASGTTSNGTTAGGGDPSSAQAQPQRQESSSGSTGGGSSVGGSIAGAALGRLGGFGRRKKDDSPDQAPAQSQGGQNPQSGSGTLMEMTMTLTSFTSGPADTSKFEVPAGYKQVEPDARRGGR